MLVFNAEINEVQIKVVVFFYGEINQVKSSFSPMEKETRDYFYGDINEVKMKVALLPSDVFTFIYASINNQNGNIGIHNVTCIIT